jgi:glycopeptide antibiotics resistance protein
MALTFKAVFVLLVSALALCQASSDPDPVTVKILEGFDNVTTQSNNLRIAVQSITIFNAAQEGFIIAEGFTSIIAKIAEGTIRVDSVSTGPLSDDDAQLVVQALTKFVQVHQALLQVIIGKHGLVTLVPFFEPIRLALVSLEAAVDTLAFDLIALIPTQKPAANAQFASLSATLTATITAYSQPFVALADPDPVTVKILEGFDNVTTQSNNLRIAVQSITIFNAAQEGFIIAEGFTSIIAKIAEGTIRVDSVSTGPLSDDDAQLVVQALTKFVQVHQALLQVIIGKHGLVTLVPFFEPIRLALVSLEAAVDTLAFDLIALIPTQKPAANAQFASLSATLTATITAYSQPFVALADPDPVTVKILEGFDNVTTQSNNLRIAVQSITIFNAAQEGFIIAEGFTSIIAKIAEGTIRVDSVSTGPLSDDDAQLVVQALTKFVQVHQALLQVIIGKHGLVTLVPFFEPIRLALVSLEAAVDTLAFDLIALIPTQKPAANAQFASLSVALTATITTYSPTLQASRIAQY